MTKPAEHKQRDLTPQQQDDWFDLEHVSALDELQARVEIDEDTVEQYRAALEEGESFPPVVLFDDGERLILADGFHRYFAHARANRPQIFARVYAGDQRDAHLYSLGANARHGKTMTVPDKRKAVQAMLDDAEWSQWSSKAIARHIGLNSDHLPRTMRPGGQQEVTYEREGQVRTMKVGGIREAAAKRNGSTARSCGGTPNDSGGSGSEGSRPAIPAETEPETVRVVEHLPEAPPARAVEFDGVGMVVDPRRVGAYKAAVDRFERLEKELRGFGKELDDLAKLPGGEAWEKRCSRKVVNDKVRHGSNHLDALRGDLKASVPVASHCPYCHRKQKIDPACNACKGTDWVSKAHWEQAPEDFKRAVLAAHGGAAEAA